MRQTSCNEASHPSPPPKCQSGALVRASCWAAAGGSKQVRCDARQTDRQTKQMTLTQPLESLCLVTVSTQTERQDSPLLGVA